MHCTHFLCVFYLWQTFFTHPHTHTHIHTGCCPKTPPVHIHTYARTHCPAQVSTTKGTGGDVIVLEEAAYCDQGFFYETVAPLMLVGRSSLLAISTLTSEINFYTRLIKMKDSLTQVGCVHQVFLLKRGSNTYVSTRVHIIRHSKIICRSPSSRPSALSWRALRARRRTRPPTASTCCTSCPRGRAQRSTSGSRRSWRIGRTS